MAEINAVGYDNVFGVPEFGQHQMALPIHLYDTYVSDGDESAGDQVLFFRLPPGYIITDMVYHQSAAFGADASTVDVGLYQLADDGTLGTVVDLDGYFDGILTDDGAVWARAPGGITSGAAASAAGIVGDQTAETVVVMEFQTITTGATASITFQIWATAMSTQVD